MSDDPQLPGPYSASERLRAAQTIAGTTRHYTGPGLGTPPPWDCPSCGRTWTTEPSNGCAVCIAAFRVTTEETLNEPVLTTTTTGQQARTEASGRLTIQPAAPTNENAKRAVSPLLETRGLSGDRLADAIAEKVLERLTHLVGAPPSAPEGAVFLPAPSELYAIFIGLQLIAQSVADGAVDPLLPALAHIHALIQQVEALPTLQDYLINPSQPLAAAPIPEEPQA